MSVAPNKPDSAVAIALEARDAYDSIGKDSLATMALGAVIDILLEKGDNFEVKKFFNRFEKIEGVFDDKHNIKRGMEIFYYLKGLYYLKINHTDSATILFNKLLREAKSTNHRECANYGLAQVYKKLGKPEMGLKYALQAYALNDSTHRELSTSDYQRNQAEYNYSRHQHNAEIAKEKNRRTETELTITLHFLAVVFLLATIILLRLKRRQKEAKLREIELNDRYARLQLAKKELEDLNSNYIYEKTALENEIVRMKETLIQTKEQNNEEKQAIEKMKDEILQQALMKLENRMKINENEIHIQLEEKQEEIDLLEAELTKYREQNIIRQKNNQNQKLRTAPISVKFFSFGICKSLSIKYLHLKR